MVRAATVCLLLLLLAPACFPETGEKWVGVRSKNFLLIGNASGKDIRRVAARLEQFRDGLSRLGGRRSSSDAKSSVPTTVIVFKSDWEYTPFKPQYQGKPADVAGYFQPGRDVNYITLSVEPGRERSPYELIFHEYAHLFVRNNIRNAPLWLNEGLAEYYSTFRVSDGERKVTLGASVAGHARLLRTKELLPLEALFAVGHQSPDYFERDKRAVFYAQSWALVHYLLLGRDGGRQTQFLRYLELLAEGVSDEDCFRRAFNADYEAVENELREYVRRAKYTTQVAAFDERLKLDENVESVSITEAEAQAHLGDLLLHTDRSDEAENYLHRAIALDAKLATAHASLGVLRARQGRFEEAEEHLRRALALDSRSYLAHYYYAHALSRRGLDGDNRVTEYAPETAAAIRAALHKAIELAPTFVEPYRLLAFVNLATNEQLDEAALLLERAQMLAPDRQDYALLLAQIHLSKQEFNFARRTLETLLRGNNRDPHLREQALALLAVVAGAEERAARLKIQEALANADDVYPTPAVQPCDMPYVAPQKKAQRFRGEQACGQLTSVECAGSGEVTLLVGVGDRTLKFYSRGLRSIRFVTYAADIRGAISCGARNPANPVLVTYRPARDSRATDDGEVIAVEFLPEKWN